MVRPAGFEPTTVCLEGRCSIQLSYRRVGVSIENEPVRATRANAVSSLSNRSRRIAWFSSLLNYHHRFLEFIRLRPYVHYMSTASFSLAGQTALVTGSSQGIGRSIARGLALAGANVVLNGRDETKLERVRAEFASEDLSVQARAFDVTDETAVQSAANEIGAIDILFNNAGIHRRGPLAEMSVENFEAVLTGNLTSAFLVARAFIPAMIERGQGKIINICSIMSNLARPTTGNYAASKGGLAMLTKAMTAEWAQHNVQINGIAPGYIDTPLNAPLVNDPKFSDWVKSRTPSRRWGTPEDLVGPAVFFASPASNYVNGQILTVDGGMLAVV